MVVKNQTTGFTQGTHPTTHMVIHDMSFYLLTHHVNFDIDAPLNIASILDFVGHNINVFWYIFYKEEQFML